MLFTFQIITVCKLDKLRKVTLLKQLLSLHVVWEITRLIRFKNLIRVRTTLRNVVKNIRESIILFSKAQSDMSYWVSPIYVDLKQLYQYDHGKI